MNVVDAQPRRRFRIVDVFSRACSHRRNPRRRRAPKSCPTHTTPANPPPAPAPAPAPEECPICFEPMTENTGIVTLGCGHEMCPSCFAQHARNDNRCPMCRTDLPGVPAPARAPPSAPHLALTEETIYELALMSVERQRATHGDDLGGGAVLNGRRNLPFRRACLETLLASHAQRTMRIARAFLDYPTQV